MVWRARETERRVVGWLYGARALAGALRLRGALLGEVDDGTQDRVTSIQQRLDMFGVAFGSISFKVRTYRGFEMSVKVLHGRTISSRGQSRWLCAYERA